MFTASGTSSLRRFEFGCDEVESACRCPRSLSSWFMWKREDVNPVVSTMVPEVGPCRSITCGKIGFSHFHVRRNMRARWARSLLDLFLCVAGSCPVSHDVVVYISCGSEGSDYAREQNRWRSPGIQAAARDQQSKTISIAMYSQTNKFAEFH
jgi:hypothetical protein